MDDDVIGKRRREHRARDGESEGGRESIARAKRDDERNAADGKSGVDGGHEDLSADVRGGVARACAARARVRSPVLRA